MLLSFLFFPLPWHNQYCNRQCHLLMEMPINVVVVIVKWLLRVILSTSRCDLRYRFLWQPLALHASSKSSLVQKKKQWKIKIFVEWNTRNFITIEFLSATSINSFQSQTISIDRGFLCPLITLANIVCSYVTTLKFRNPEPESESETEPKPEPEPNKLETFLSWECH